MDEKILQLLRSNPQAQAAIQQASQKLLSNPKVTPELIDKLINLLAFALQKPDSYREIRAMLLKNGAIDQEDLPEQFDPKIIVMMLAVLRLVKESMAQKVGQPGGFARGGLAELAAQGRNGDTRLAHINPVEDKILRAYGGSGSINPNTGLQEYGFFSDLWDGIKSVVKTVAPIVLSAVIPGAGTILGSALIGGASSALTGGNILQGAALGGLGAGLGGALGSSVNEKLGLGLSGNQANVLGSALVGGGVGAATGRGFMQGATQGAIGGVLGNAAGNTGLGDNVAAAGRTMGNAMAVGYDPKTAATMGASSGLMSIAKGALSSTKPADAAVSQLEQEAGYSSTPQEYITPEQQITKGHFENGQFVPDNPYAEWGNMEAVNAPGQVTSMARDVNGNMTYGQGTQLRNIDTGRTYTVAPTEAGTYGLKANPGSMQEVNGQLQWTPTQQDPGILRKVTNAVGLTSGMPSTAPATGAEGKFNLGNTAMLGLMAASALQSAPEPVKQEVGKLSASQQEYFNRPSITWDWSKMQNDANASGLSLSQYMARNWNKVAGGAYNTVAKARGGALGAIARYAEGSGSGRADTIDAKLSDGEYVLDAETVAMLGDGSNKAGAQKLDEMREQIRKHKGKVLAKGKFSPNAKSPLAYIKEMV